MSEKLNCQDIQVHLFENSERLTTASEIENAMIKKCEECAKCQK